MSNMFSFFPVSSISNWSKQRKKKNMVIIEYRLFLLLLPTTPWTFVCGKPCCCHLHKSHCGNSVCVAADYADLYQYSYVRQGLLIHFVWLETENNLLTESLRDWSILDIPAESEQYPKIPNVQIIAGLSAMMLQTLSNRFCGIFRLFTLAALRSSFCTSSFLPWVICQRADSGRSLKEKTDPDRSRISDVHNISVRLVLVTPEDAYQ